MDDLRYEPVLADVEPLVLDRHPDRLLVVGHDVPDAVVHAASTRHREQADVRLPTGSYWFVVDGGIDALVVTDGAAPGAPAGADWSAPDDDPLVNAFGWFSAWWDDSGLVPHPRFTARDHVVTVPSGQEGTVRSRSFDAGAWWYQVRVEGRTLSFREASLAEPEMDDDPLEWVTRPGTPAGRFSATLTRAKLQQQLTDTVYSFRATRTLFRPYQFRPVIRLLSSGALRLLIADEVGLGKTIEAGLVWTELDARNQAHRVLVVCPSMLVAKWQAEMEERFSYELLNLDRGGLDQLLDRVENDRLPPRYHAVCSVERLRIWSGLERLAELAPRFDLVIVDEAHVFRNMETRSHALGALLSDWADALVFLSATPLNLGNDDLYNLLQLLAPGEFDDRFVLEQRLQPNAVLNRISASFFDRSVSNDRRSEWLRSIGSMAFGPAVVDRPEYAALAGILGRPAVDAPGVADAKRLIARLHSLAAVVTRTRKVEIQDHKAVREAHPIEVQWTPAERAFYRAFDAWQRRRAVLRGLPVGFVTQMPLRLASTCLPAARDKVLDWGAASWSGDDLDPEEPGDDGAQVDEELPPPELVELAKSLGDVDSKFGAFLPHLMDMVDAGKRLLVFTFSRAALAYLQRRLSGRVRLASLHGGIPREERHTIMARFRAHDYDVLLASRVASEGLDFEFCSAVVNYDLPWNPMEVEQRIGRIDRFGQTEDKVLILNFHTPGTIETDIIERVHQRIGVFTDSIGELEPILQSQLGELRRAMFDFRLSDEQRERRLDEMLAALEEQRLTKADVETAAAYLSSVDGAEIDGLERDLTSHGRYVGQPELVRLLDDWSAAAGAPTIGRLSPERVAVRGNAQMEAHLRGVQAAGERSSAELADLLRAMRNESDIVLCLDQEMARTSGQALLSATHPLVRAALRVPGYAQARFSSVTYTAPDAEPGKYLVLIAVSRWVGLRPSTELWTSSVSLLSGDGAPEAVGLGLLVALAEGKLEGGPSAGESAALDGAVRRAMQELRRRQAAAEDRLSIENELLVRTRRISLRETHARKVSQIGKRIATLKATGKTGVIHLQEAQLRTQERLLQEADARLDQAATCSLDLEHIAVCLATVGAP